jgi:MoxR-like ATPase
MLTDVPVINQKSFKAICKLAIRGGGNVLVLGPSGGGKTFIAKEAADEENCRLIYINLSVLERTDFQGFPVISDDKTLVSYATPDFLPFADTATRDERASLQSLIKNLDESKDNKPIITWAQERMSLLDRKDRARAIIDAAPWIAQAAANNKSVIERFKELLKDISNLLEEEKPIVFLFDEVDKALTETTQTLLELLQFTSINGRNLNIRACVLTGNLPDEHAHTNQISHAISKRCKTFKLEIDFNQWREWAFKNNVHDHIIQFLSNEPTMIYKTAPDGDVTAYAMPSPRTWTDAAESLANFDADMAMAKLPEDDMMALKFKLVAGCVGDSAAAKFRNWFKYYRQFDPIITDLVENGKMPDVSKNSAQEKLIMAISACSKVYAELKPKNDKRIKQVTKNVYSWIDKLPPDAKMGAVRLSFGGDWDNCHKYGLPQIPEFVKVFREIKQKLGDHNADLSPNKS